MCAASFRVFLLLCSALIMSCGHKAPLFLPESNEESIEMSDEPVEESASTDQQDAQNKDKKDSK